MGGTVLLGVIVLLGLVLVEAQVGVGTLEHHPLHRLQVQLVSGVQVQPDETAQLRRRRVSMQTVCRAQVCAHTHTQKSVSAHIKCGQSHPKISQCE